MIRVITIVTLFLALGNVPCPSKACDLEGLKSRFSGDETTLSKPMSIEEIEAKEMVDMRLYGGKQQLPFGYINADWEKFKNRYKAGDCIAHYSFGVNNDVTLGGERGGYILVRGDEIITAVVTEIE